MRHHRPRRSRFPWWVAEIVLVLMVSAIQAVVFLSAWIVLGVTCSAWMALVTSGCLIGLRILWRVGARRDRPVPWTPVPRPRGDPEWDDLIRGSGEVRERGPDPAREVRREDKA